MSFLSQKIKIKPCQIDAVELNDKTYLVRIYIASYHYFTDKDIHDMFDSNENFHFSTMHSRYADRDISFVKKTVEKISQSHFLLSNFYIGSGKDFFKLIKNELHTLGVNEGRIISENC
ncbi:hypothetical protein SOASR015_13830 [Pectobacterium carotovorum subsp. carotovorum]|nr:hypothetical protein SOASR015_13830 [Pectobacterium carotovorum subsp. carotovorum]GLX55472.1 hypothetical protein Pcaca02_07810 [Pectobacterium carotovorum subsp. carotovorum]